MIKVDFPDPGTPSTRTFDRVGWARLSDESESKDRKESERGLSPIKGAEGKVKPPWKLKDRERRGLAS